MTIYDVNKLLESNIPEGDYDTLSGYLQEELGRIPTDEENPIIETEQLTFKIEEIMACGDGMNDYEMIKKVGFGVVMDGVLRFIAVR